MSMEEIFQPELHWRDTKKVKEFAVSQPLRQHLTFENI